MMVRLHPEADQELIEAREWYAARSEVAAQAFSLEIDHAIERERLSAPAAASLPQLKAAAERCRTP